jgi:adenylate cyclase
VSDIFISYSRKDSEAVLSLAEELRARGLDVWIDQHGLIGSVHYGAEIAEGLRNCQTYAIVLSQDCVESESVLRELSIAVDRNKRILPIELEMPDLPSAFEYPLAGLQRVKIADIDGIVRAHKHGVERKLVRDPRRSMMVLPFEDLSPGQDNAWFSDGLTGELITALTKLKSLHVVDRLTSMSFKHYQGRTTTLAKELDVRYFLQGSVRKMGEQIKINVELLDIESGDYLWQGSMKGTMEDIFDLQENVAEKVVEGFKLHLTKAENAKLRTKYTQNPEAYELYLKATEYFEKHTREGLEHARQLFHQATELDPQYADAMQYEAYVLADIYRIYQRDPAILAEAEALAKKSLEINPNLIDSFYTLCVVYRLQGRFEEAEQAAIDYVRRDPENYKAHFSVGLYYAATNQPEKAIQPYRESARRKPNDLSSLWNLVLVFDRLGRYEERNDAASGALDAYERWLRLHPDDETRRTEYAHMLRFVGRSQDALNALAILEQKPTLDAATLYNIACFYISLEDYDRALKTLERAVDVGFRNLEIIKMDPDLNPLREMPRFQALIKRIEAPT